MIKKVVCLTLVSLALVASSAQAAPPSEASIRELLEVTQSKKMVDAAGQQYEAILERILRETKGQRKLSPAQEQIIDDFHAKSGVLFKDFMKWEKLEPLMIDIHRKSFTQEELDGMLAFYKSPAGQAVTAKMPIVMQQVLQAMQSYMAALLPEIKKLQDEMAARLKAEESKGRN